MVYRARMHDMRITETWTEEIANAVTHGIGAGLAIAALVLCVIAAAITGSPWAVIGATIYGASLVFCFLASTLYHGLSGARAKRICLAFDHCAIFLLIAGTYTPIILVVLEGWEAWLLFTVIWALAIGGVAMRLVWIRYMHPAFIFIYLAMGWCGFLFAGPLAEGIGERGIEMLLFGGLCYTGGLLFYAWRRLPFNHAIWHLAVLAGTILHFFVVYEHVLPKALVVGA
jgi:hemolysin III